MPGTMVELRSNGQTTPGYLALPEHAGPGIVVIQEWWGLVDHIRDLADRFSDAGFCALAPDLFRGEKTRSPDHADKMLMALNIAQAAKDIRGAATFLLKHQSVNPKKVATVGFCMGGQLALFAATEYPGEIAATVDFYGIHPNAQIDPQKLQVPVQAHFGVKDSLVTEGSARQLIDQIRGAGKSIESHFYEAGHAFFNDTRPEAYHKPSADIAWDRTLSFLRSQLI
jgi:carboxymethylenebutenolidase